MQSLLARSETLLTQRQIVHDAMRNLALRGDLDRAGYTRMKAEVVRRSVSMKDMMKHRPAVNDGGGGGGGLGAGGCGGGGAGSMGDIRGVCGVA